MTTIDTTTMLDRARAEGARDGKRAAGYTAWYLLCGNPARATEREIVDDAEGVVARYEYSMNCLPLSDESAFAMDLADAYGMEADDPAFSAIHRVWAEAAYAAMLAELRAVAQWRIDNAS